MLYENFECYKSNCKGIPEGKVDIAYSFHTQWGMVSYVCTECGEVNQVIDTIDKSNVPKYGDNFKEEINKTLA